MAKSSKVEDYWRQNNIEGLFKELTHMLVQRMPSDPAVAIVQHLQKKFSKSFVTSTDNNDNIGIVSKTMTNNLQLQSTFSPRSDVNNDSTSALEMQRRSSNQSQVSDIATIPTLGSAFTDLLKQDTNRTRQAPELDLKTFIFANRLSQHAVKMRKDIRSDRDIIEEELIKPTKIKANISSTTHMPINLAHDDPQHEQPPVKQLIKYKQRIRFENDRRLHQIKLAELAKQTHDKEQFLQSDLTKPDEIQKKLADDQTLSHVVPGTSSTKLTHKPSFKSKEEEEILNDENIFQPRRRRYRERGTNKLSTLRSNRHHPDKQHPQDFVSSMPIMQFGVCKVCGNIMTNEENQSIRYSQPVAAAPTKRSFETQPSLRSVASSSAIVDDWFESPSDVAGSRQVLPWKPDDVTPLPQNNTNPFQENLFQPINDNNTVQRRPPASPLIMTDDETKTKRSTTPRMSESDVFIRTTEPRSLRSPSPRSIPSPVTKKHQTDTLATISQKLSKTMVPLSPSPQTVPITQQRIYSWSVSEHAPDDSDEN